MTCFLVLTLLIPAGAFALVRPICLMTDVGQICAHPEKNPHPTHGETAESGSTDCEFRAAPQSPPAVAQVQEVRIEAPQPAETPPLFLAVVHHSDPTDATPPGGVLLHSSGGDPPLFIRHCSLLN